ncbi:hypothetical protein BAUCODRAFT_33182 [Baudoinia panamericana UAMH 10762]|uniref:Mitochondrial carrier protein n=1 Tax=Baudoinia panamericana (strain UAMH 10762) TaxID=717646 RepID=M2MLC1_BAUPA|nr:uncharacterized protein BAUCODRAFT_33182 [Baudoinia panamericana UAMH 10762]EMC97466.1 hypothetical protein BAUCODRAFT_33182 [Baudoinia panamericana UAMH 10762]
MPSSDGEDKITRTTTDEGSKNDQAPRLLADNGSKGEGGKQSLPRDLPASANKSKHVLSFQPGGDFRRLAKKYRTEIAASSSSVLSTFVAFPLDFAKSRMQSYETGFLATIKDAYRAEGLRTFWRGVGPPLVSVTVVRTFSFSIYQRAKYTIDGLMKRFTGHSPLHIANAPGSYPNIYTLACFGTAGAVAGAIITTLSCPFELTKLNEQLAGKEAREKAVAPPANGAKSPRTPPSSHLDGKTGSWNTARRLIRDRGFQGLYAGYKLHLLRDTIGTAIYFTTYESAKQLMANARGRSPTSPYAVLVAGGLCGILTSTLIYPIDVAKTLYQKALLSAGSAHTPVPPIRVFQVGAYRGLGVSVIRSCFVNMIFFSNFEMVKRYINALD